MGNWYIAACNLDAPRFPATGFALGLMGKLGRAWVGAWLVHGCCMGCAWHGVMWCLCGGGGIIALPKLNLTNQGSILECYHIISKHFHQDIEI